MARQVYYDLTELMTVKGSKFRVYGIARVVAEVAKNILPHHPEVTFVFHSQDHDAFFHVAPKVVGDGQLVDFHLPDIKTIRYRERVYMHDAGAYLTKFLSPLARRINLARWKRHAGPLVPVDMSGGVFHSSARPKLISNMILTIQRRMQDVAVVPMLHDLIPLHDFGGLKITKFANNFYFDNQFVMENSATLIANSQFTADDIVMFSDAGHFKPPPPITPVPLVHEFLESDDPGEIELPKDPYFLMVGTMLGRKNLDVVLDAYRDHLLDRETVPLLVLAGAVRERTRKALASERYTPIADYVKFVDRPSDTDLKRLYQNARGLIIASRIEGWGLPAGEALWLGTPAICTDIPVLREVAGDLGLYFGLDDPQGLAAHLNKLVDDDAYFVALKAQITDARTTLRTWRDVARDIMAALATQK